MLADIITIGDEILIGQIVDTNSAWIAQRLNESGIKVRQITSVSDEKQHILNALQDAHEQSEVIIITGGLGPTSDDITKPTLSEYFGSKLTENESVLNDLLAFVKARGIKLSERNRKQAEVPECCTVIRNPVGTAPAMWFEKDSRIYISLPGVPFEMIEIMEQSIIPKLVEVTHGRSKIIIHKNVLTHGISESHLAVMLADWERQFPTNLKLAYLPQPGIIRLRLTIEGKNEAQLREILEFELHILKRILPDAIFGEDEDSMEGVVGRLLLEKDATLSVAESCTGGNISHLITLVSGSSKYYKGSVVAYSNETKYELLKVNIDTLINYGAVSKQTAAEMAKGVKILCKTDYAIAITGIAGPDGGSEEKPVGTTWIAVATPDKIISQKFHFGDNRELNIMRASVAALNLLRLQLI